MRPFSELRLLVGCILNHPSNRRHRTRALLRLVWWQIRKKLTKVPAVVRVGANRRFKAVCDSAFSSMVVYTVLPEWDEMRFLLRILRPSDGFLDIGANVGFYTVLASTIVTDGPLLAFEANPRNLGVLRDQIELNKLARAEVFGVALGKATGEVRFLDSCREMGTIARADAPQATLITVPCARLDDCLEGRDLPAYVVAKMDVEGCENLVLEGATATLRGGRVAVWLFELNQAALRDHDGSAEMLFDIFVRNGYSLAYWDEELQRLGRRGDDGDMGRENYVACLDFDALKLRIQTSAPLPPVWG